MDPTKLPRPKKKKKKKVVQLFPVQHHKEIKITEIQVQDVSIT